MATATIEITLPGLTGFTLTLDLYLLGSDTAAVSGLSLTEATNRKGTYTTTTTAGLSGSYLAIAKEGSTVRGEGYVGMTDTASVHVVGIDLPGKVLGGGSGTISGVGARVVDGDGDAIVGGATAADVWSYASRTLTMTAAEIEAAVAGTDITIQRGDLVTIALTGLGALTSRTGEKLRFTVKSDANQPDTAALVQVTETTGAIYVAGSAASAANLASIAVTDASTGAVTISLTPTLTAALPTLARKAGVWDIQLEAGTGTVETLATGKVTIVADVSRAVP